MPWRHRDAALDPDNAAAAAVYTVIGCSRCKQRLARLRKKRAARVLSTRGGGDKSPKGVVEDVRQGS